MEFQNLLNSLNGANYAQIKGKSGIAPCCPEEEIYRLDIKYQLLELQAIKNPDYVCTPSTCSCNQEDTCGCSCNS